MPRTSARRTPRAHRLRPLPECLEDRLCLSTTVTPLHAAPRAAAVGPAILGSHPAHALSGHQASSADLDPGLAPHYRGPRGVTPLAPAAVPAESLHEDGGPDHERVHDPHEKTSSNVPLSVNGINSDSWTPPDDNIAVSDTTVVEAVNEQLAFYNTAGGTLINSTSNIGINTTLFPNPLGGSAFDPRITYDPANGGHFILVALEQGSSPQAATLDIAASVTPNPTDATPYNPATLSGNWYTYRINVMQTAAGTNYWMDFPGLGIDGQAIYVTGNMFGFGSFGGFHDAQLLTFDKSLIEAGKSLPSYPGVTNGASNQVFIGGSFGIQPAVAAAGTPITTPEFMVEALDSTHLRVHAVTNPLGPGALNDSTTSVPVPQYGTSFPKAAQKGSRNLIATNDDRVINAVYSNGSLWAAHTIGYTTPGTSTTRAVARWYQIDTSTGTPALRSSGNVDPGKDGSGYQISTFFPSIAVDPGGANFALSYAQSSKGAYPSASYTTAAVPASGTFTTLTNTGTIQKGLAAYGGNRWGDYSGVVAAPTPAPGKVFYAVGEDTLASGAWGTWWLSF